MDEMTNRWIESSIEINVFWMHVSTVENTQWKNFAELKAVYPKTDYIGNDRYVFNIKGNKYRIVTMIRHC